MNKTIDLKKILNESKGVCEKHFKDFFLALDKNGCAEDVYAATKYSVLNGGKRIRAFLSFQGAGLAGAKKYSKSTLDYALGIELIHAYSLVHDDLPALDNDMLRRGKPSTHAKFSESTAILAGDALLNLAAEVFLSIKSKNLNDQNILKALQYVFNKTGILGMVSGQCLDLKNKKITDIYELNDIYYKKTGCLIAAALVGAYIMHGGNSSDKITKLEEYSKCLGLSYQYIDDLLDKQSNAKTLGKSVNTDKNKTTAVDILGIDGLKKSVDLMSKKAIDCLTIFGNSKNVLILQELILHLKNRTY